MVEFYELPIFLHQDPIRNIDTFSPVIQENIRAERAVLPGAAGQAAPGGGVQGRVGGEATHHCST